MAGENVPALRLRSPSDRESVWCKYCATPQFSVTPLMHESHPSYFPPFFFASILLNNKRQTLNYFGFSNLYHILHSVAAFAAKMCLHLSLSVCV